MMEEEVRELREEVRQLRREVNQRREAPPAPGRARRAMNFMYNAVDLHAAARNFIWAIQDGAVIGGYLVTAAGTVIKATPAMLVKAKAAYAAAMALAAANPIGAGIAAGVGLAAIERATRYEDEEGNTRHACSIM